MAEITIKITDLPNNKVSIQATPSYADMAQMINSGTEGTGAHGYAMRMLRAAKELSMSPEPTIPILIPRIGT